MLCQGDWPESTGNKGATKFETLEKITGCPIGFAKKNTLLLKHGYDNQPMDSTPTSLPFFVNESNDALNDSPLHLPTIDNEGPK